MGPSMLQYIILTSYPMTAPQIAAL